MSMDTPSRYVTTNDSQELFVIPCGAGYTCLGYDVAYNRHQQLAAWLGRPEQGPFERGTLRAYTAYEALFSIAAARCAETGEQCPIELTPQLVGLEGRRVEVVDAYGQRRRFIVGKSTGWMPCHIERHNARSAGGPAAMGPYKSVMVIR